MITRKLKLRYAVFLGCAYISYLSGSGFGSGQEMTQYFAVHGPLSLLALWGSQAVSLLFTFLVIGETRKHRLMTLESVYRHFCGPVIGKAFYLFSVLFMVTLSVTMIAGAGATLAQCFGCSELVARALVSAAVLGVCMMGMSKILRVTSVTGPIILFFVIGVSVLSIARSDGVLAGAAYMAASDALRISDSVLVSWLMYTSLCVIFQVSFWQGITAGSEEEVRSIRSAAAVGIAGFGVAASLSVLALTANAALLDGVQVPNLELGRQLGSWFAALFSAVLVLAVTSAIPMIWTVARVFAREDTPRYRAVVVLLVGGAFVASGFGSFDSIVNTVCTISSYAGFAFLIPALYTGLVRKKREQNKAGQGQEPVGSGTTKANWRDNHV